MTRLAISLIEQHSFIWRCLDDAISSTAQLADAEFASLLLAMGAHESVVEECIGPALSLAPAIGEMVAVSQDCARLVRQFAENRESDRVGFQALTARSSVRALFALELAVLQAAESRYNKGSLDVLATEMERHFEAQYSAKGLGGPGRQLSMQG